MTRFVDIPARSNGQETLASWYNLLKAAGVAIEGFLGAGYIEETGFTIANNQSSAASVTGLVFAAASYRAALIRVMVRRKTDSEERISIGYLRAYYISASSTWELIDELGGNVDDGVEFTITAAGQIQYTSDNQAGANYTATMRFAALTFAA